MCDGVIPPSLPPTPSRLASCPSQTKHKLEPLEATVGTAPGLHPGLEARRALAADSWATRRRPPWRAVTREWPRRGRLPPCTPTCLGRRTRCLSESALSHAHTARASLCSPAARTSVRPTPCSGRRMLTPSSFQLGTTTSFLGPLPAPPSYPAAARRHWKPMRGGTTPPPATGAALVAVAKAEAPPPLPPLLRLASRLAPRGPRSRQRRRDRAAPAPGRGAPRAPPPTTRSTFRCGGRVGATRCLLPLAFRHIPSLVRRSREEEKWWGGCVRSQCRLLCGFGGIS